MTEIELHDAEFAVSEDMNSMVNLILTELFHHSQELDIWTYHDPQNAYRVEQLTVGSSILADELIEAHHHPVTRVTEEGIHVLFHHRRKKLFRVWIKLMKWFLHDRGSWRLTDRCGLTLVMQTKTQIETVRDRLKVLIERRGGSFVIDSPMDEGNDNPHSGDEFRVCKCLFEWKQRTFEVMFMLMYGHYNAKYSIGEENHRVYRTQQMLDVYLPLLYPKSVYGIDWKSGEIRQISRQSVIECTTDDLMRL